MVRLFATLAYGVTMTLGGWNFYQCNINDKIASVYLNLDLFEYSGKTKYPNLNWYWIKLNKPREDGLSSDEEYDSLIQHEDKLIEYIEDDTIIFAGRVTTHGRREFYFYTQANYDFSSKISNFVGSKSEFLFQVGEKADPNWEHYQNVLYPGENGIKQILNRK